MCGVILSWCVCVCVRASVCVCVCVCVLYQGCLRACSQVNRSVGSFSIRLLMKSLAGGTRTQEDHDMTPAHTCKHTFTHTRTYTHTRALYTHTRSHTHIDTHTRPHICTDKQTQTHTPLHTHICMPTHIHTHTHGVQSPVRDSNPRPVQPAEGAQGPPC